MERIELIGIIIGLLIGHFILFVLNYTNEYYSSFIQHNVAGLFFFVYFMCPAIFYLIGIEAVKQREVTNK